jgi:hypothetical protein
MDVKVKNSLKLDEKLKPIPSMDIMANWCTGGCWFMLAHSKDTWLIIGNILIFSITNCTQKLGNVM